MNAAAQLKNPPGRKPAEHFSSQVHRKSTSTHGKKSAVAEQVDRKPASTYREHALAPHLKEYEAVATTLESLYKFKHLARLEKCRSGGMFMQNVESGKVSVMSTSCHVRGCPICAAAKAARVGKATGDYLANEPMAKLLTLTMRHTEGSIREQIIKLNDSFRKFRRLKEISSTVKGGFWFMEFKLGKDNLWHIHLHCLVISPWIAKERLSELWHQSTQTSYIIDIRKIKDARSAAIYVGKYVSKPAELRFLPLDKRQEILEATKSVRTHGSWGCVIKQKFLAKPAYDQKAWRQLGTWRTVSNLIKYDERARAIWKAWTTGSVLDSTIDVREIDSFIDYGYTIPPNEVNVEVEQPRYLW